MKKIHLFLIYITAILAAGGCLSSSSKSDGIVIPDGYGAVRISINHGAALSKTVFPDWDKQELEFRYFLIDENDQSLYEIFSENGNGNLFIIPFGTYKVNVKGYIGDSFETDDLAVVGTSDVFTITSTSPMPISVPIILEPIIEGTGTGTLKLTIRHDANTEIIRLALSNLAGDEEEIIIEVLPSNAPPGSVGEKKEIPEGYYLLNIVLENNDAYTGKTEVVHIYQNVFTEIEYNFLDTDVFIKNLVVNTLDASISPKGSLRYALANADDGDIIRVMLPAGRDVPANEIKLNSSLSITGQSLTIEGNGVTITTIAPPPNTENRFALLNVNLNLPDVISNVTIKRVHFKDGNNSSHGGAIFKYSGNLTLESCIFSNNISGVWGGAIYNANGNLYVRGCTFYNNISPDGQGGAIFNQLGDDVSLKGNLFYGNRGSLFYHIIHHTGFNDSEFNIVDRPFGTGNGQSGFVDETQAELIREPTFSPYTFKLFPNKNEITITRPDNYPTRDFYGNLIPAGQVYAGAVQTEIDAVEKANLCEVKFFEANSPTSPELLATRYVYKNESLDRPSYLEEGYMGDWTWWSDHYLNWFRTPSLVDNENGPWVFSDGYIKGPDWTEVWPDDADPIIVTDDVNLYAKRTPREFTITFDPWGGTGGPAPKNVTFQGTLPALTETEKPTQLGYTFLGYFDHWEGGTKYYNSDMTPVADKVWDKPGNAILYAQWEYIPIKQVSAGHSHSMAIKTDGTLWGWGSNEFGQIGQGVAGSGANQLTPVQIGTDRDWKFVSADRDYTMAIKGDGELWAWGTGNNGLGVNTGKLGLGLDIMDVDVPTRVGIDTNWASVFAGQTHTMAIKTDGSLWAWGNGGNGKLGLGSNLDGRFDPEQVGEHNDWVTVSTGNNYTMGIRANGTSRTLWAWGNNGRDQLGGDIPAGTNPNVPTPVLSDIVGNNNDWVTVSVGSDHTMAIKGDGELWAWGDGGNGKLGIGEIVNTSLMTQVVGSATDWKLVSAGNSHTMAIKTNGSLWAWGSQTSGKLGNGSITGDQLTPIQIKEVITNPTSTNPPIIEPREFGWESVSVGSSHTIAIRDGELWAWGLSDNGRLGLVYPTNGNIIGNMNRPIKIIGRSD